MNDNEFFKLPRLFVEANLAVGTDIPLSTEQAHYFKTVLRRQEGDLIRLFNGQDGEFICSLQSLGKKDAEARVERQIRAQPAPPNPVHLFFAPIKKSRLDWLIEKAVELGATDLHPVLTQNTEVRDLNQNRVRQQMLEAAEQCERLDRPVLHDVIKLKAVAGHVPAGTTFLAALERGDRQSLAEALQPGPVAILIGPEGGFTEDEAAWVRLQAGWQMVSLGPRILRCETAVCAALATVMLRVEAS